MAVKRWKVCIPNGRWMSGPNHFHTKVQCEDFIEMWNQVEVNAGQRSLTFYRDGQSYLAQLETKKGSMKWYGVSRHI